MNYIPYTQDYGLTLTAKACVTMCSQTYNPYVHNLYALIAILSTLVIGMAIIMLLKIPPGRKTN